MSMNVHTLLPDADLQEPIILHLSKANEAEAHAAQLEKADLIFAQLTVDTFQPNHLATARLRQTYGDKVIVWPNIFYSGQQPYLRYFTHETGGRMIGPLDAMHDIRLHQSWMDTGQVQQTAMFDRDTEYESKVRAKSFASLQEREKECDAVISDLIRDHEQGERLFFTFNHPSRFILHRMAMRLLDYAGLSYDRDTDAPAREPLSRFQVPSNWGDTDTILQGNGFQINDAGLAVTLPGAPVNYSAEKLCDAFQTVYDANPAFSAVDQIRQTPKF